MANDACPSNENSQDKQHGDDVEIALREATKEDLGFEPTAPWLGRRNCDVLLEDIHAGRVKMLHRDIALVLLPLNEALKRPACLLWDTATNAYQAWYPAEQLLEGTQCTVSIKPGFTDEQVEDAKRRYYKEWAQSPHEKVPTPDPNGPILLKRIEHRKEKSRDVLRSTSPFDPAGFGRIWILKIDKTQVAQPSCPGLPAASGELKAIPIMAADEAFIPYWHTVFEESERVTLNWAPWCLWVVDHRLVCQRTQLPNIEADVASRILKALDYAEIMARFQGEKDVFRFFNHDESDVAILRDRLGNSWEKRADEFAKAVYRLTSPERLNCCVRLGPLEVIPSLVTPPAGWKPFLGDSDAERIRKALVSIPLDSLDLETSIDYELFRPCPALQIRPCTVDFFGHDVAVPYTVIPRRFVGDGDCGKLWRVWLAQECWKVLRQSYGAIRAVLNEKWRREFSGGQHLLDPVHSFLFREHTEIARREALFFIQEVLGRGPKSIKTTGGEPPADKPSDQPDIEEHMLRVAKAVGDDNSARILAVAQRNDLTGEEKMEAILRLDRRYEGKTSVDWGTLLGVSPDTIRGYNTWKLIQKRKKSLD